MRSGSRRADDAVNTDKRFVFQAAKEKAGGRRCRPFPVTDQREEVLAACPGEKREEVPPAGYLCGACLGSLGFADRLLEDVLEGTRHVFGSLAGGGLQVL